MSGRSVITRFGGISALANALRHKHPSTVQGWWTRNIIPAHQQANVLEAARDRELHIEAIDLIHRAPPLVSKGAAGEQKTGSPPLTAPDQTEAAA
jgi:hypothetical protein